MSLFQFLKDKPIASNADTPLAFGHAEIVDSLEEVVLNAPEAFTIGLFGDWGSGKSTITESLYKKLKANEIPLLNFDVWKHEGDSLRRTFLIDISNQLQSEKFGKTYFPKSFKLGTRLNQQIKVTELYGYKFQFEKLLLHLLVFSTFAISIGLVCLALWLFFLKALNVSIDFLDKFQISLLAIFTSTPILFFYKYLNQFIIEKKEEYSKDKFEDPVQFENQFKKIIRKLKQKKIVIVFDNLDRVNGKKAVEIISTIKTFLEPADQSILDKKVIFIIPCDSEAIVNHLGSEMNYAGHEFEKYTDEYLRKFFNTILWIPDFYSTELESLAAAKLKETKIPEFVDDNLSALIVAVFSENPRQIIQFINILITNYVLLKTRVEAKSIQDQKFLSKNVPQLAKYILLKQRFPKVLDFFKKYGITDLGVDLRKIARKYKVEIEDSTLSEFEEFLLITEHVKILSLDVFFKFRAAKHEQVFNNLVRFHKLIQGNQIKELKEDDREYLESLDIKNKINDFNLVIKQKVSDFINPVLRMKYINGLFHLTKFLALDLQHQTYNILWYCMNKSLLNIHLIEANLILTEYIKKNNKNTHINEFKDGWLTYIKGESNEDLADIREISQLKDIVYCFIELSSHLKDTEKNLITNLLIEKFSTDLNFMQSIIGRDKHQYFISDKLISEVISNFDLKDSDSQNFARRLEILNNIHSEKFSNNSILSYFKMGQEFLQKTPSERTIEFIVELFNKIKAQINTDQFNDEHVENYVAYFKLISSTFETENYKFSIHLLAILLKIEYHEVLQKHSAGTTLLIDNYINTVEGDKLVKEVSQLNNNFFSDDDHLAALKIRISNDTNILCDLIGYVSKEIQLEWIEIYIPSKSQTKVQKFLELVSKIETNDKFNRELASILLAEFKTLKGFSDKELIYEELKKCKQHLKKQDFADIENEIISLLNSESGKLRELGLTALKDEHLISKGKVKVILEELLPIYFSKVDTYHSSLNKILSNFNLNSIMTSYLDSEENSNDFLDFIQASANSVLFDIIITKAKKSLKINLLENLTLRILSELQDGKQAMPFINLLRSIILHIDKNSIQDKSNYLDLAKLLLDENRTGEIHNVGQELSKKMALGRYGEIRKRIAKLF